MKTAISIVGDLLKDSFSRLGNLYHFVGLIFVYAHTHAHILRYTIELISQAQVYFSQLDPLEDFPLYRIWCMYTKILTMYSNFPARHSPLHHHVHHYHHHGWEDSLYHS